MNEQAYDIVIVGAGSAGVAAAVSASQENLSVLLVEKSNRIGGMATKSEVGTICGLYLNDDSTNFAMNVDDFTRGFAEELEKRSEIKPIRNSDRLKFLPYKIEVFEEYCTDILKENNVDVLLQTELNSVELENKLISKIKIQQNDRELEIKLKAIIDCSGINVVSVLAGEDYASISYDQTLTRIFTLENIKFSSVENLSLILLLKTKNRYDLSVVPGSYSGNKVSLKYNFTNSKNERVTEEVKEVFSFLKQTVDGFIDANIKSISDETGLRIGNRVEGEYILTEEDVLSCRKFENSVANGNWPIEIWKANENVKIIDLKNSDYYQIPESCLRSKALKNLFFAGRNISADEKAIASARVIGVCLQTGSESGKMAVKTILDNVT